MLGGKKGEKKTNISPFPATHTYIKVTLVRFFSFIFCTFPLSESGDDKVYEYCHDHHTDDKYHHDQHSDDNCHNDFYNDDYHYHDHHTDDNDESGGDAYNGKASVL